MVGRMTTRRCCGDPEGGERAGHEHPGRHRQLAQVVQVQAGDEEQRQVEVRPEDFSVEVALPERNRLPEPAAAQRPDHAAGRGERRDFAPVLRDKNALVSLDQVIRELEESQKSLGSPIVLNGRPFGFFANHSLVMANYISRANAAVIDLRGGRARSTPRAACGRRGNGGRP